MAVTLTANLTEIEDCDSTSGWSSNETLVADTSSYREGTGSIAIEKVSQETSWAQYDYYTDHSSTYLNITGETHIYFWTQSRQVLDYQANGGIRIRLTDASGNYREWWVGGYDNYYGGFQNYVIYTGTAPAASSGTLNLAQIRYITFYWKVTSKTVVGASDCFVDIIYHGTGLVVKGGTSGDKGTLDQIITADVTPAYGVLSKKFGAFIAQGPITFGDNTGATTTYFSDSSQIFLFANAMVSSTHYAINVVGNSSGTNSVQFGSVTGSGSAMVGAEGIVIKSVNTSLPFTFNANDNNIDELKLYGNSLINASNVYLGNTSTALGKSGSTIYLVDNSISNPTQVTRNISTSATKTSLRNNIVSANNTRASINIYDGVATNANEWTVLEGAGFENSNTATTTTITGEAFPNTAANKPYVSVLDNASAVWNFDNVSDGAGGRISVTDQTEIAFDGNANGDVNERFIVTWKVKEPDGTDINLARCKIIENAPSVAIANESSTDSNGDATSTYLRALYEPSGATTINATTHTPSAYKVYKYGKTPFVGSATINSAVNNNITLLPDNFKVEASEATAVADGTQKVVFVESSSLAESHSIITFEDGTGTLTVGNTVDGVSSGASGTVEEIIQGDSADGTVILKLRNSTAFSGTESLQENAGGGDWSATLVSGSEHRYYWLIQAGSIASTPRTLQQLYDHFQAKLAESPLDTADGWDDVILEGRSEYANPIEGVSTGATNTFKTVRNVVLTHGWVVSGLNDLAGLAGYTDNSGGLFTPVEQVILEINGVKTGEEPTNYVRVRIEARAGGPLAEGTTILNSQATTSYGSEGFYKATTTFDYSTDQPVIVRARYKGYLPYEANAVIGSAGLTVTAIWQVDPNFV